MDMGGKPTKKPYKPYITSPRRRGGRGVFRPRKGRSSGERGEGWPDQKEDSEVEEEDPPTKEDSREGSLTRPHYKEAACIWQARR